MVENIIIVPRDKNGNLTKICPINQENKIGSFDCTFSCKNNRTKPKEVIHYGFEIPKVRCSEIHENQIIVLNKKSQNFKLDI